MSLTAESSARSAGRWTRSASTTTRQSFPLQAGEPSRRDATAKRRKAVYVDNIYIEHGGAGGYQHVGGEGLLDSRFHTAGGAAKRVLKALRTVTAPDDASRVFFDVGTSTGAIFRVYVNCEGDEVTVSH